VQEVLDQHYWDRDIGGVFVGSGTDNKADGPVQNSSSSTPGEPGGATVGGGGPPAGELVGSSTSNGPGGVIPTEIDVTTVGRPGTHYWEIYTVRHNRTAPYIIEIRDGDSTPKPGSYIATLEQWGEGSLRLTANQPGDLTFRVLANNANLSNLEPPNFLYVRDAWGYIMDQYIIIKKRKVRDGDAAYVEFTCQSILVKCAKEIVESYSTGYEDSVAIAKPLLSPEGNEGLLIDLLALQTRSPIIGVGAIDPLIAATEVTYSAKLISLQAALMDVSLLLQQSKVGYWYVDSKLQLQWRARLSNRIQSIIVGKGLYGVSAEYNYEERVNRVYAYGAGNDFAHSVGLEGNGHSTPYLESGGEIDGIRSKVIRHRRTSAPAAVADLAARYIEEYHETPVSISCSVISLCRADTDGYGTFDDIFPGTQYWIVDEELGINELVWLKSVTHNMQNPLALGVEFTRQASDMGSYVGDIAQQLLQPFTVEDDGTQNPYVARAFPNGYEAPEGFAHKVLDLRESEDGVMERYDATNAKWHPLGVWVPYDGE
jgi:hypothetical protein